MNWIKKNARYFYVFGGMVAVLFAVAGAAAIWGPPGFWKHVLQRNLELHLMAGAGLYLLFKRLLLLVERRIHKRKGVKYWRLKPLVWFLTPVACVMAISLTQEYGLSLMGESFGTLGGDWKYNEGSLVARAKSFADNATWLFGSLAAAWSSYFCGNRDSLAYTDWNEEDIPL